MLQPALFVIQCLMAAAWLVAASWVGRVAYRLGYRSWPWVAVAIVASPFVAWFVLLLISPRDGDRQRPA